MDPYLIGGLAVVVVAAVIGFRIFGQKIRCPFCREWLPRGAALQVGRTKGKDPYLCPFCDHVIQKRDLQRS
jgi:hypothetical protein